MENKSDKMLNDNKESSHVDNVLADTNYPKIGVDKGVLKNFTQSSDVTETRIAADWKGGESCPKGAHAVEIDAAGDVNMEASITPDDVIRAGGFGARDDISSFLPVASDSTDFEASIRDARDYEEPQGQVSRPGLGWTGAAAEGE
ncbi:hypothetical protein LR48_Vigan04g074200 [Vigna angularis]|uniref:Uncharacterized protein n=2 Tax=Phaseolus angularis TaxID=3914 RepID=A0A0L9UDE5_PHAAN|nr:uncharacterized protein LOC108330717 [Vigna angularis]XP_017420719.1 uncharacterized protein LOC108330717 [Vigna angularis]XP_017420720.1 uncharacterized protein LOC108330717 [Vigna angularis]XP_052729784.1 uncharacterized protein LOC108330717 [Vigna angularis]XP_052729785.1 uncharacterized protein LOC108330717 [Vigna angularis]XP_052729786.1 uncharacterized protein LOC108330717 [Vigna angularis]BAT85213.1 hypothetical protein VIGAN_04273300 [Vigna angularis var. angularis]KAG2405600.1 un